MGSGGASPSRHHLADDALRKEGLVQTVSNVCLLPEV